jgi:tryptophan synthase beta chain
MAKKIFLDEEQMPRQWYNILPDLPFAMEPMLNPATMKPVSDEDLHAVFPLEMVRHENSRKRFIDIPEEVRDIYRIWRPSPLYRADRLEKYLDTPAKIYFKWEGVSPPGSHKPNTAIPQAYYNRQEGKERMTTETGAGQWGSALSFATRLFGLECTVYMARISFDQKPFRKSVMRAWGAECLASPTTRTEVGRGVLEKDPDSLGSLMIAISEAMEDAATHSDTGYGIGSLINSVCMHQTMIGLEAQQQFAKTDDYPDVVIGCVGGGSNFAGSSFPFIGEKLRGERPEMEIVACEPMSCPTMTKGVFAYDYGDVDGKTPLIKMLTLGHTFMPPAIHAGGLRLHCDSPIVSKLVLDNTIRPVAYHQNEVFEAATLFARTEGFVVAPETAHAVKGMVDEALRCRETGEEKTILFNASGHGLFDLAAYDNYNDGDLLDYEFPADLVKECIACLPKVD